MSFRASPSSVPIAELPSLSALKTRSFSGPKALLMTLSAVFYAAPQRRHSAMEMAIPATQIQVGMML